MQSETGPDRYHHSRYALRTPTNTSLDEPPDRRTSRPKILMPSSPLRSALLPRADVLRAGPGGAVARGSYLRRSDSAGADQDGVGPLAHKSGEGGTANFSRASKRKIALRETYCTAAFRRSFCRLWVISSAPSLRLCPLHPQSRHHDGRALSHTDLALLARD